MANDASGSDGGDDWRVTSSTDPGGQSGGEPDSDGRQPHADRSESDDEYRVPLDLSGDADGDREDDPDEDETEDEGYVPEPSSTPIEPGDPTLENAIFVILGAVAMGLVLLRVGSILMV